MNIKDFQAQVNSQGLSKNNRWVCTIYPPSGLTSTGRAISNVLSTGGSRLNLNLPGLDMADAASGALSNFGVNLGGIGVTSNLSVPTLGYVLTNMGGKMKALNLFTASCNIPSRELAVTNFVEYGEARTLAFGHLHTELSIEYYCSEDLRERKFFEQWQDMIFNPQTKQHSYYKDYISRVEIAKYDSAWKKKEVVYRFNEAFPTSVGAHELVSDNGGDLLRLTIGFKYRNYEISGPGLFEAATDRIRNSNIGTRLGL